MLALYRTIIDRSANSLKDLPDATRFPIPPLLVLVSTTIFVTGTEAWMWFCPLVVVLVVAGRLAANRVTFEQVHIVKSRRDCAAKVALNSPAFLKHKGAW